MSKILVVDDNPDNCDLLSRRLTRAGYTVLVAGGGQQALNLIIEQPFDLVMLDINMPDMDGCDALKTLAERFPSLPVVMLTASESMHDMRRSFDAGASGYIPKSSSADIMLGAIRLVMAGSIYVPPSMAVKQRPVDSAKSTPVDSEILGRLTQRQTEVLTHLRDGISNKQIADRMGLSEATVKVHMSAILKTLGMHSRVEAALVAQKLNEQSG